VDETATFTQRHFAASAATVVGMCRQRYDQAEAVMRNAAPEVAQLVESGAMALNEAHLLAGLPKDQCAFH